MQGEVENKDQIYAQCRKCGRALSNRYSVKRGYGPVCYKFIMRHSNQIELFNSSDGFNRRGSIEKKGGKQMGEISKLNDINKNDEQQDEIREAENSEDFRLCGWCGNFAFCKKIKEVNLCEECQHILDLKEKK